MENNKMKLTLKLTVTGNQDEIRKHFNQADLGETISDYYLGIFQIGLQELKEA